MTENVNKMSFKQSLQIMSNSQGKSDFLVSSKSIACASNQVTGTIEENGSQVLCIKDSSPTELWAKILNSNFNPILEIRVGAEKSGVVIENHLSLVVSNSQPLANRRNSFDF